MSTGDSVVAIIALKSWASFIELFDFVDLVIERMTEGR